MTDEDDSHAYQEDMDELSNAFHQLQESDRKRGILTKQDRKYLFEEVDVSGQNERNTRYRIRQRLYDSLIDTHILNKELSDEDLRKVLQKEGISPSTIASNLLRLAYRVVQISSKSTNDEFTRLLELAVQRQFEETEFSTGGLYEKSADVDATLNVREIEFNTSEIISTYLKHGGMDDWIRFDVYFREKTKKSEEIHFDSEAEPEATYIPTLDSEIGLHPVLAEMVKDHKASSE